MYLAKTEDTNARTYVTATETPPWHIWSRVENRGDKTERLSY